MKKERGITQGWLYLIALLAITAALAGLVVAWTHYTDGLDKKGYDRGVKETEARYAERDNAALQAANSRIQELQNAARAKEQAHQADMAAIETKRLQEVQRAKDQRDRDIAAVVAGTLKLRDPGKTAAAGTDSGGGRQGPEAGAGAGKCDGQAGGQLSDAAAGFLLGLVGEADAIVGQLADAQAVIISDRAVCNAP